jgi:hypothetical protein
MASVVIILKQKVLNQAPDRDTITELLRPLYSPSDSSFRLHETMTTPPHGSPESHADSCGGLRMQVEVVVIRSR